MKYWTRGFAITAALVLLVGISAPAIGKRGNPTKVEPLVTVELTYESSGLATTCGGPLVMGQSRDGFMRADWNETEVDVVDLEMSFPIRWMRNHPEVANGESFVGCHGSRVSLDATGGTDGFFILDPQADGSLFLYSRFDYFWAYGPIQNGKGKVKTGQTVLEFFEISAELTRVDGETFDPTPGVGPQTVTGTLEFRWFEKLLDYGVWTDFDASTITMTITVEDA